MDRPLSGFTRGASVAELGAGESDSGRFYEQLIAARGEQLRQRHRQLERPEASAATAAHCVGQPEHPSGGLAAPASAAAKAARVRPVQAPAGATASDAATTSAGATTLAATGLQASGGAVRASFYEQLAAAQARAARRHRQAGGAGKGDTQSAAPSVSPTDTSRAPPAASAAAGAADGTEVSPEAQAASLANAAALPEQRSTNDAAPARQSTVQPKVAQTPQGQAQVRPAAATGPGGSAGARERPQAPDSGDCTTGSPPAAGAPPGALGIGPALEYGISRGNVGFRLLKKAGWQEGAGLGRSGQGRQLPLERSFQVGRQGLGRPEAAALKQQQQHARQAQQAQRAGQPAADGMAPQVRKKKKKVKRIPLPEDAESAETRLKRHRQTLQADADDKAGKAIARYLHLAFKDGTGAPTADNNPLLRQNKLSVTNPLL